MAINIAETTDINQFIKISSQIHSINFHHNYYCDEESIIKFFSIKNPFWLHAEYILLTAEENNKFCGRVAIIIDYAYNKYNKEKTAFFGFFEINDNIKTTKLLLTKIKEIIKKKNMTKLIGPIDGNMFNNIGLLTNNFNQIPNMFMANNPSHYQEHFKQLSKQLGLKKHIDIFAYNINFTQFINLNQSKELQNISSDIKIIPFKKKQFDEKLAIAFQIYSEAYGKTKHWLYYPITYEEFYYQVQDLKQVLDENLTLGIYYKNVPVGFVYAIPNFNLILNKLSKYYNFLSKLQFLFYKREIKQARLALICILPKYKHNGFGSILAQQLLNNLKKKGFINCEYSWVLETNTASRHLAEKLGGKINAIYRVYEMNV